MNLSTDVGNFELMGFSFYRGDDYKKCLGASGVDSDTVFSTLCRNLGSVECVGEYFREQSGLILTTEEYDGRQIKPDGSFISPPGFDVCIGDSKSSQLVIAIDKQTKQIIGSLLTYVADLEAIYSREFKSHYNDYPEEFREAVKTAFDSPEYNLFASIGINIDIAPRLRLRLMLQMVRLWANQLIENSQEDIPCLAEMNKGSGEKENGFFRACKKNFDIKELTIVDERGNVLLAKNNKKTYNSHIMAFGRESIIKMANY